MQLFSAVKKLLPPPSYMRMPSVGIDLSDSSLKYMQFRPADGNALTVAAYGELEISEGVLARGEVKDTGKLSAILAEVRRRTHTPYVRLALPEEGAYLFETRVAKDLAHSEVRGALEFRLEENVPLSPRDAYFDYDIYPLMGISDQCGVSVTAYGNSTINTLMEACTKAELVPISFEVESQAIARAILPKGTKGTHLIIDCGKLRTGIGIVHNGILMYTSTIDLGGRELSSALRKQLKIEDEAELTRLKNTQGLMRGTNGSDVYDALIATISAIKDEVAQRIEYWNSRDVENEDRFVDAIHLCGGSSNLRGLPEYFSETFGIETTRANVWQNAFDVNEAVPPVDRAHAFGYATAIGLGLGSFI